MANERITENLVREYLRDLNYFNDENISVEEQKSQIEEVKKLLKNASKTGLGGIGSPEFIVSTKTAPDFIFIIECKALIKNHTSLELNKPKDFAVDGAIHYAKFLSKNYSVITIAVSGQTKSELKISCYLWPKNSDTWKILENKSGKPIETFLRLGDFIHLASLDREVEKQRESDLMSFSRELHDFMRDHAKLTEAEKPLLVSGTLIALKNIAFAKSFDVYQPQELQKQWIRVIKSEIDDADIPNSKRYNMTQPYTGIAVNPNLGKATVKHPRGILYEIIKMLNDKVWPFIDIYHDFDVVGQFYGEFLKYTGGDKKALGIVLTPRHITELFALLANVNKQSRVLDICAGTGGFLISAMHQMVRQADTEEEIKHIKEHGLYGVEQQPGMFALAASNMILRGDGKANLYMGSCFDTPTSKELIAKKCDVGMLNPPYSQGDSDLHELVFVKEMLDCLTPGGVGISIIPMSCAISPNPKREEILKNHTLEAVMSMPDDLFYPVGVVTCIMIFTAHKPHKNSNKKTWFGYWKNDGFTKTKMHGRIDFSNKWGQIRDQWISSFLNRDDIPGISVKMQVDHTNEWCAEAYMETDYSTITKSDFEAAAKKMLMFKLLGNTPNEAGSEND